MNIDDFTAAYLECALWAECDDESNPLDRNYSIEDFAPEAIEQAIEDCAAFQADNTFEYNSAQYCDDELAGHDFWLTRNRHGAGFWDRDLPNGDQLTEAAHAFGSCNVYVGDDGKLYLS